MTHKWSVNVLSLTPESSIGESIADLDTINLDTMLGVNVRGVVGTQAATQDMIEHDDSISGI